jgi:hypothetical protein
VDNSKYNSKTLLLKIADRLKAEYATETTHLVSAGHPVSDAAVKDLKSKADIVIAGIGDRGSCSLGSVLDGILFEKASIPYL